MLVGIPTLPYPCSVFKLENPVVELVGLWISWTLGGFPGENGRDAWQGAEPTWELCVVMLVKDRLIKKLLITIIWWLGGR